MSERVWPGIEVLRADERARQEQLARDCIPVLRDLVAGEFERYAEASGDPRPLGFARFVRESEEVRPALEVFSSFGTLDVVSSLNRYFEIDVAIDSLGATVGDRLWRSFMAEPGLYERLLHLLLIDAALFHAYYLDTGEDPVL